LRCIVVTATCRCFVAAQLALSLFGSKSKSHTWRERLLIREYRLAERIV